MHFMNAKQKGCVRFEFGRDWDIKTFPNEEEAMDLNKVPYNVILDNKQNLLQSLMKKDMQMQMMEARMKDIHERNVKA